MSAVQELEPPNGTHRSLAPDHEHAEHPTSHEERHEAELLRPVTRLSGRTISMLIVMALASGVTLFLSGSIPRRHQSQLLESESQRIRTALPKVRVIKPRQASAIAVTMLPGDVQAMEEITVYPRTTGYVKRWLVDIGDEVEEGELLMEIDIPEVRAQLQQSEATLAESKASLLQARANANLAGLTTNRFRELVAKRAVSQQELDNSENNLAVTVASIQLTEATVDVNKANVQQLRELVSFSQIRAPFAGTVTARNVDTGKLVTAGNATGQSLFQLARTNPVRIFVNVPQYFAPGVTKGMKAKVLSREMPGRVFEGIVTRTARAIDQLTRTLLTEIQVPNDDHALLTGSYVQVRMEVEIPNPSLLIPPPALVFNAEGTQVAVIGPNQTIQMRAVEVAGDLGRDIAIATGITADENVVINPGDRMSDGLAVEIEPGSP